MADSSAPPFKRIRKGTKSCIECRSRKIRCIWEEDGDQVCTGCKTRHRKCVPQVYQRRSKPPDSLRADRIERLERRIASIAAAVQEKGQVTSGALSPSTNLSPAKDDVVESRCMEGPASTPPTHLRFLFDNSLISATDQSAEIDRPTPSPCSPRYLEQARARLQHFMPAKADVRLAAGYGTAWMSLHQSLFTSVLRFGSKDELIDQYDDQLAPSAQPVDIASFLLVFAITVRQIPPDEQCLTLRDIPKYIQDVLNAVEATIISHTGISSTVEGLSTIVLYMRLQLGIGQIRPLWLTLRRTIAIAELIGLPRTWNISHLENQRTDGKQTVQDPRAAEKVALWEAICAVDRLSSMTFNLPAATSTYPFPKRDLVSSAGVVMSPPYLLELAGVAMRIQELDESYNFGQPKSDIYEKVLCIDKDIRSLKSSTPSSWWVENPAADVSGDHLVQFWHYYLLVRTHVHSAMSSDEHDQFGYSRTVCAEACQALAHRYGHVRRRLPPGFFVCRILDMQIFTAAVFLVLTGGGQTSEQSSNANARSAATSHREPKLSAVKHILSTMESVSGQVSGEFAQEATAAIRSLMTWTEAPAAAVASAHGLTLRIPLLGKIHIATRKQVWQPQLDPGPQDSVPWYMELDVNSSSFQEDPFIADGLGDWNLEWMEAGGFNFQA